MADVTAPAAAPETPNDVLAGLTADEKSALVAFENAVSKHTFKYGGVSPFNQGAFPTEDQIAARQEEIRTQLRKMKKENPKLYARLPLLHDLLDLDLSPEDLATIRDFENRPAPRGRTVLGR